jgi:hypothetical protein
MGRRMLSDVDTTMPHTSMNTAMPQRPVAPRYSMPGIHTMAAPPAGSSARIAASTPNTTGDGSPAIAKPIATSTPCTIAVSPMP